MDNKAENKILNLIKVGPFFVILFSILITYVMIENNNQNFEKEIERVKEDSLYQKKESIKNEIDKVLSLIENEKQLSRKKLKENIKERVYTAHTIATSIYNQNRDKSDKQIKQMIKETLRSIRFYDNRGYFFIYDMKGKNVLHPMFPHLEEKILLDFHDSKGTYNIKEMIAVVKEKKEGFLSWWGNKPDDKKREYSKIGFNKYFEPFDWLIGTGEYVADYEAQLQKELLEKIQKIRYGKNGYIFIGNYDGISLSHINKEIIGTSIVHFKDSNGFMLVQEIIKLAKRGGGYLTYGGTIMPSTGKINHKISYVKGLNDWNWAIGTGAYIEELEDLIDKKRTILKEKNKEQISEIVFMSIVMFIIIFILSLFFAKNIQNRFKAYKEKVEEKTLELSDLNNKLECKVEERTMDLKNTNQKLKVTLDNLTLTKNDLIAAEKMATLGELVSSITHEINSPLGVSIISASHINELIKEIFHSYKEGNMSEEEFKDFLKDLDEISKALILNLDNTKNLVNSFKNIAVDQVTEDKREFYVKEYIDEILLSLKSKIKKTKITVNVESDPHTTLRSYPGFLSQIITNLINNSILHAFEENEQGEINMIVNDLGNNIEFIYEDNGKGISKEIIEKVFSQYFTTKKGQGGTGLGLYIVKNIITDKLYGHINIDRSQKRGVRIVINIPKEAKTISGINPLS